MPAKATERVALRPDTKSLLDERKPDGVTYDHFIKTLLTDAPDH